MSKLIICSDRVKLHGFTEFKMQNILPRVLFYIQQKANSKVRVFFFRLHFFSSLHSTQDWYGRYNRRYVADLVFLLLLHSTFLSFSLSIQSPLLQSLGVVSRNIEKYHLAFFCPIQHFSPSLSIQSSITYISI